ncbi:MAG: right-handed parallel beta-helix repeat-containing protein, partial [Eubacteriales bacterium]|nr:right-handed parallel beta-helix repeat-containing protein [Eubacteriales bacterium]
GDIEYYLENVPQYFLSPNQWYLDRKEGMLYYIPRNDEQSPYSIAVYAPVISKLFEIKGDTENGRPAEHLRFRNLTFAYTRGDYASGLGVHGENDGMAYASDAQAVSNADGTLSFEGARGCTVENCVMKNFGIHGIVINEGCSGIRIENTVIYDGGAGGIKIAGSPSGGPLWGHTYGNKITDNTIKHCGRRYLSACGILIMHSYENEISHNEISDLYYTGISCGWVWGYGPSVTRDNLITKNHIYNLGQGLLSDMGGVYLLGSQPGTVVSGNLIHDIKSREYGGWALYTDEGSSFITLENNICYNTSDNSYHQHYGSMNTVRNNIFAFSEGEMIRVSRTEDHLSIIFENNIIYTDTSPIYGLSESHIKDGRVWSENNIIYSSSDSDIDIVFNTGWGEGALKFGDMQAYGMEKGSILADPLFEDAATYDFRLKGDSPALKRGFKPIDISDAGPRIKNR